MKAASLSGLLLARNGDARPAQAPAMDAVGQLVAAAPVAERPGLASIMRPSLSRPAEAAPAGDADRLRTGFGGGYSGGTGSVRISVRMDRDRHRKLRILAAQRGVSLQQAMIQAIDGLVATSAVQSDGTSCACLCEVQARTGRLKT
jgi:hypothetical protein